MRDKKNEIDSLLSKTLRGDDLYEEPSDELIHRLEKQITDTEKPVTTRRALKLSVAIAIAIIASLSLSMVAFGGVILEALGFRIVEGEEYVVSYGIGEGWAIIETLSVGGRVVAEVDGELWVVRDPLILTDLNEAIELFARPEHLKLPTYLPEGFEFYQAIFPISPVHHPDIDSAGYHLDIIFSNGEEFFQFHISISHMAPADDDFPEVIAEDWDESSIIEIPEHQEEYPIIEIAEDWLIEDCDESPVIEIPEHQEEHPIIETAQDWLVEDCDESPVIKIAPDCPTEDRDESPVFKIAPDCLVEDLGEIQIIVVTEEEEGILSPPPLFFPYPVYFYHCICVLRPHDFGSPPDDSPCEHCAHLEEPIVFVPIELAPPSDTQEIVLNNGMKAWFFDYVLMIDTKCLESRKIIAYVFSFHSHSHRPGPELDRETLIRMAESLEYVIR